MKKQQYRRRRQRLATCAKAHWHGSKNARLCSKAADQGWDRSVPQASAELGARSFPSLEIPTAHSMPRQLPVKILQELVNVDRLGPIVVEASRAGMLHDVWHGVG